jgi:hypothetical protein
MTELVMYRREPTPGESAQLRDEIREMAWRRARELADRTGDDPPRSPFDETVLDAAGQQAAVLTLLSALREVRDIADQLIDMTVTVAGTTGAGGQAIGDALQVTRSAVRKKYPEAVSGAPGPRKAITTRYGRGEWRGDHADRAENDAAEQDWLIRARVLLRQDAATGGSGVRRIARTGDILEVVMRGRAGTWVDTEMWQTDEPVLEALFLNADTVEVLEILEEIPPWRGRDHRDLGIVTTSVGDER